MRMCTLKLQVWLKSTVPKWHNGLIGTSCSEVALCQNGKSTMPKWHNGLAHHCALKQPCAKMAHWIGTSLCSKVFAKVASDQCLCQSGTYQHSHDAAHVSSPLHLCMSLHSFETHDTHDGLLQVSVQQWCTVETSEAREPIEQNLGVLPNIFIFSVIVCDDFHD